MAAPLETGPPEVRSRRRWPQAGAVVLTVAALTGVFGFGLSRDPSVIRESPLVGKPAPPFALRTLDGDRVVRSADLRGQVVVINFWASWCLECRWEHDDLQAAWGLYRDRGMVLLGVTYQDSEEGARAYLDELGGAWPILTDPGGRTAIDYGVYGAPETMFVAPDGTVAHKVIGPVDFDVLSTWITRLSGERT